jgi:hypothetical protein
MRPSSCSAGNADAVYVDKADAGAREATRCRAEAVNTKATDISTPPEQVARGREFIQVVCAGGPSF